MHAIILPLLDDLEHYDGTAFDRVARDRGIPDIPLRTAVESDLDSLAMDRPRLRWKTVRRLLAEEYQVTPAVFQRCAPWAQKEWRRLSKEIRDIAHAKKVAGLLE